jgi:hypothetical protein
MRRTIALSGFAVAASWIAGCATEAETHVAPTPTAGYSCSLHQVTPGGQVSASAVPDYRGGYSSFIMRWESVRTVDGSFAYASWTGGPKGISPPGWLTVSHTLDKLPPLHSRIRLLLSSGEFQEQDFVEPKNWKGRKQNEKRFRQGGNVFVHDAAFIEKFSQADWAEVSVTDPAGIDLARVRHDMTEARESMAIMRRMGEQVIADAADYVNRCTQYVDDPIEDIT